MTGKIVAAHPDRVAQADQHAAAIGAEVQLSRFLTTDQLLVIDRDALKAASDAILEDARSLRPPWPPGWPR